MYYIGPDLEAVQFPYVADECIFPASAVRQLRDPGCVSGARSITHREDTKIDAETLCLSE